MANYPRFPQPGSGLPSRLRVQWWLVSLIYLTGGGLCFWALQASMGLPLALRWGAGAGLGLAYVLMLLWHGLGHEALRGDHQLQSLGAANLVTLTRAGLYAGLAGGLFVPMPDGMAAWLPGLIYAAAAATDALDGYLARRRGQSSHLGRRLDVEVDGLGVLVATTLAVRYEQLPEWYLTTGLAYYAYRALLYAWRRSGRVVVDLPPSTMRRTVGGFQVGFLAVVLLPLVEPPTTTVAGVVFASMFFVSFLRDGLLATGTMSVTDPRYRRWQEGIQRWLFQRAPVVLRAVLGGTVTLLLARVLTGGYSGWSVVYYQSSLGPALAAGWLFVTIVTSTLIVLGAAGRLATLGTLSSICAHVVLNGFGDLTALLLITTLLLLFLGTGTYSLCRPEDRYLVPRTDSA